MGVHNKSSGRECIGYLAYGDIRIFGSQGFACA